MGKRVNDNAQLSKEEFEANSERSGGTEIKYGITLADDKTLRKRRILKVSGSSKWSKSASTSKNTNVNANASANPFGNMNASTSASNPFQKMSTLANSDSTKSVIIPSVSNQHYVKEKQQQQPQQSAATSSNPFASISIANNITTPKFPPVPSSNGSMNNKAKEFDKISSSNNLMSHQKFPVTSQYPTQMHSVQNTMSTTESDENKNIRKADKLFGKFVEFIRNERKKPYHEADSWELAMDDYIRYATVLQKKEEDLKKEKALKDQQTSKQSSNLPFPMVTTAAASSSNPKKQSVIPPNPSKNPFQLSPPNSTTTALTFSFGKPITNDKVNASAPPQFKGFSFPSTIPPPPAPTSTLNNTTNDSDDGFPKEKTEEALTDASNTDETVIYSVKGKYYKYSENKWTDHGGGKIQLYEHKENKKKRLVMRTLVGKVQLNVSIGKGMKFDKAVKKTSGSVRFMAMLEAGQSPKLVMLKVALSNIEPFHQKLEEMAK